MKTWLIVLLGWLVTSVVLLTAYNLTAYAIGWSLPFAANVAIGFIVGLIGLLIGALFADKVRRR